MTTRTNHISERVTSMLLTIALLLGLVPAMAMTALAAGDVSHPSGQLEIWLVPMDGNGKQTGTFSGSITASVLRSKDDDTKLVLDKSTPKVKTFLVYTDLLTNKTITDETIYWNFIQGSVDDNPQDNDDSLIWSGSRDGSNESSWYTFDLYEKYPADTTIFISANTADGRHFVSTSIDYRILNEAKSGIKYSCFGMQVRTINNEPLGKFVYGDGDKKFRTMENTGMFRNVGGSSYKGLDGRADPVGHMWDGSFFDIQTHEPDSKDGLAAPGHIINIDEVQGWLEKYYVPILKARGEPIPASITVSGPAYIVMYDDTTGTMKNVEYANLEYYQPYEDNAANKYVSWGETTRKTDFVTLRNFSMIVPLRSSAGDVTINCWDSETRELLHTEHHTMTKAYAPFDTYENYVAKAYNGASSPWMILQSKIEERVSGTSARSLIDRVVDKWDELYALLHSYIRDMETGKLTDSKIEGREALRELFEAHQETLDDIETRRAPVDSDVANAMAIQYFNFPSGEAGASNYVPELNGYLMDYGFASEALYPAEAYRGVPILKETPGMKVSVSQAVEHAQIDLYYIQEEALTYKIKIRLNGVIDESLTRIYPVKPLEDKTYPPIEIDDPSIGESKKLVPPEYFPFQIVQGEEEEPMPLLPDPKDPDHNVIIIDCINGNGYTVKVRVNGAFRNDLERSFTEHYDYDAYYAAISKGYYLPGGVPKVPCKTGDKITINDIQVHAFNPGGGAILKAVTNDKTGMALASSPLVLEDPATNIIILDFVSGQATYKVYYYKDHELQPGDTKTFNVPTGTKVRVVPLANYDPEKWAWERTEGLPTIINDNTTIIHVYYRSLVPPAPADSNAKLTLKEYDYRSSDSDVHGTKYKGVYKSGYGFFGYYFVNVPSWMGHAIRNNETKAEKVDFTYEVEGGCGGPSSVTKTFDKYINITWEFSASWEDAFIANNKTTQTAKGRQINFKTSDLWKNAGVDKLSTDTRLCFQLPANTFSQNSLRKAYIPVGWKDGSMWPVKFHFKCDYQQFEPRWKTLSYTCDPHVVGYDEDGDPEYGTDTFSYDYDDHWYSDQTTGKMDKTLNVKINGNMYEDDFTGSRR